MYHKSNLNFMLPYIIVVYSPGLNYHLFYGFDKRKNYSGGTAAQGDGP